MPTQRKILVVTPRFPYPEAGACEQDRAEGIRQLRRLGYEVRVLAKYFDWQNPKEIETQWERERVPVTLVPYSQGRPLSFFLTHPWRLDGAAAEYAEPRIQSALRRILRSYKPDLVWFDYTYLWPLFGAVREHRLPIVVRSINVEARHFLDEDGRTLLHYLKYPPKMATEFITARRADAVLAITPREELFYHHLGARRAATLPLRSLPGKFGAHSPRRVDGVWNAFFCGSTYSVAHNRRALEFVARELAPFAERAFPGAFMFFVTGAKFPKDIRENLPPNVRYVGFVKDMEAFLADMDIAVSPSFFGAGMQQKIFEPLARGFPTITNRRGLSGYDFVCGEDVLCADTAREYVAALDILRSFETRARLSAHAKEKSAVQFSQDALDAIVKRELERLIV